MAMHTQKIETVQNLVDFLYEISEERVPAYTSSLEQYLRSLLKVTQQYENQKMSPSLAAGLFEDALTTEPVAYDPKWLDYYCEPPSYGQVFNDLLAPDPPSIVGYVYLIRTLRYQIADLNQIYQQKQKSDERWGPVESPSGNRWYNLDLAGYLECGARGFEDHSRGYIRMPSKKDVASGWFLPDIPIVNDIGHPLDSKEFYWQDLAEILWLGQLYE